MKLSLAIALAHKAELILMDEPTSGLDPVFRRELLERLSGLIRDGRTSVLFSTHITSDLERVADYITFIRDGELVFSTTRDDVLENWAVVKGGPELLEGEENYYQTIGGFVMRMLGRVPQAGDHFTWQNMKIEVVDMDWRRVDKVLVMMLDD